MSYTVDVYIGEDNYVHFDENKLEDFIDVYNQAVIAEKVDFTFEANVFTVEFAKYVIEFVQTNLPK